MPEIGVPVRLVMVGTNHRHAPIEVREQLAAEDHGGGLVEALMRHEAVAEAVGLSTCNRCELYMVGTDEQAMRAAAIERLGAYAAGAPHSDRRDAVRAHRCRGGRASVRSRRRARLAGAGRGPDPFPDPWCPRGRVREAARPGRSPTACSTRRSSPASGSAARPRSAPAVHRWRRSPPRSRASTWTAWAMPRRS